MRVTVEKGSPETACAVRLAWQHTGDAGNIGPGALDPLVPSVAIVDGVRARDGERCQAGFGIDSGRRLGASGMVDREAPSANTSRLVLFFE